MYLEYLYIATRTRNVENAGSSNKPDLIINGGLKKIPFTDEHRSRGRAGFARIDIGDLELLPEEIDYSIAAGGNNLWKLDHAAVWGQRVNSGNIYPLSFGAAQELSKDEDEGVLSFTPPLVSLGSDTMLIRRLLIVLHTSPLVDYPLPPRSSSVQETGTDSDVNLQIGATSGLVVDYDLPETPQADLKRSHANYYISAVPTPFTRQQLTDESIVLSIRGENRWDPLIVVIFGIDTIQSDARALVPLVHVELWPFMPMSTDPEEGVESVRLPLAPMDDPSVLPPFDGGLVAVRQLHQRLRELEERVLHYENK